MASFTRRFPGPRSSQFEATNVNNLLFTSNTLTSSSSPVNVSTSKNLRFCARLSSYARATSVKLSILVFIGELLSTEVVVAFENNKLLLPSIAFIGLFLESLSFIPLSEF